MRHSHRHSAGFTLVELLLAVAITAIIMTGVGGAFLGILQAREEVRSLSDSTSAGPRILALIERDLRGLWHHNIKDNKVFLGRNREISGFPADRLDFLTTTDAIGAVEDGDGKARFPTICEVGYWMRENPQYRDLRELWRREDPMVDGDLATEGHFQLVHDRVKTFEVTYYRSLGAEAEPVHEWDSSKTHELPRRLKIELTVERNLPNRNRVSGTETGDFEDTILTYTRHIVFDRRYPDILRPGVAMIPVLPPPPSEEGGGEGAGPAGAGAGGGGGRGRASTQSAGPTGISGTVNTTGVAVRGSNEGRSSQNNTSTTPQGAPGNFNFGAMFGGAGGGGKGGGGLFGAGGGIFGGK